MNIPLKPIKGLALKNFLLCIAFILLFFVFDRAIGGVLKYYDNFNTIDKNSLMWNDLYKSDTNSIDVMFLGSSHARFAFDTRIFNNELKLKSFNLSSSEQTPIVGYFSLKEALKYQTPKVLVYEAYWRLFGVDNNTTAAYFAYDYMKGFDTKFGLLASMYNNKNFSSFLAEAICKTYKYRDGFFPAANNILNGRFAKPSASSNNIKFTDFTYYQNGYYGSDKVVSNTKLFKKNPFEKAGLYFKWNETQIEYFKKTIKLCNDNNIKVIVVTAPLPKPTMNYVKNYEEYSNRIKSITSDLGLEYIDYNLINIKDDSFKNEYFCDSNHLNTKGTELLDYSLIPVLKKYLN